MTITVATDVLISAATGRLLCQFSPLHEFLEKVAGGSLWTHQLPDAMRAIEPHLRAQHPWLDAVVLPPAGSHGDVDPERYWRRIAAGLIKTHGATHEVEPMTNFDFSDPIADLVERVGKERVIPITVGNNPI